jgi:hypothetical protein
MLGAEGIQQQNSDSLSLPKRSANPISSKNPASFLLLKGSYSLQDQDLHSLFFGTYLYLKKIFFKTNSKVNGNFYYDGMMTI